MELKPGEKLGPYEVIAPIGRGGMGEVWRARDPRLGREVAIKVSARQFTDRFEREARAIAALNHPNVCTLYDLGPDYLVMELVDGPTLAERIQQGKVPLEETLGIAKQIADALEAAHEKGIVHRDLKPANIKIRPDGSVKVLDFGLAKASAVQEVTANSPTITLGTQVGMIVGTAGYMSPEQARGKEVDKRADIWAFGVVLHEMLTGERMFRGETATEVLASVLKEELVLDKVPARIRPLLRRCIEKDPKKRLRDIGEAMVWVENAPGADAGAAAPTAVRRNVLPWAIAAAAVVLLGAALWILRPRETDRQLVRHDADMGADIFLSPSVRFVSNVAISPDGTRLAFVATDSNDGPSKLFTRRLDQPKAIKLPGTEGALGPFFSPDGQWVGYSAGGKLNKISVEGGAAIQVAQLTGSYTGGSWLKETILLGQLGRPMLLIPASGGPSTPLTEIGSSPQLLPGGKAVLFGQNTTISPDTGTIEVLTPADHRKKTLVHGGASGRYVASSKGGNGSSGHLLYVFNGSLFALPFDLDRLETHGTAVRILDDLAGVAKRAAGKFDVSETGTLVYQKASAAGLSVTTMQWMDASGKGEPIDVRPGAHARPKLSPDGKKLLFWASDDSGNDVLQVYDLQTRRTAKLGNGVGGVFSPDGLFVVFDSLMSKDGLWGLQWARADGGGQPRYLLSPSKSEQMPGSFSPDGKRLIYADVGGASQDAHFWDLILPVEERDGQLKAGIPERFLNSQTGTGGAEFSPDGQWLAYGELESGTVSNVFVRSSRQAASGEGGRWAISVQGGTRPAWSRASPELLYLNRAGQVMSVRYTVKGETFVPDQPRLWAEKRGITDFDIAPDGKRLAVATLSDTSNEPVRQHEVVFLENFFDELRRKAPMGR